jgi:GDP-L-fucose synthase
MNSFFTGRLALVAGGTGLIGSHVVEQLLLAGARVRVVVHSRPNPFPGQVEEFFGDLRVPADCDAAAKGADFVFQCAGVSGGMGRIGSDPIPMFTDPVLINSQLIEAARRNGVQRYALASNASVYADGPSPMPESSAWGEQVGRVENVAGLAKRVAEIQCQVYASRTPIKFAIVRGGAAYGPRDYFDLANSHVIPALVRKAVERQTPYTLWGDGSPLRDFTHARDIARGLLFATEHYAVCEPLNIATGRAVSIGQAARAALEAAGFGEAEVVYQGGKSGTPVKLLDVSKMRGLGFATVVTLEDGLRETADWYRRQRTGMTG